MQQKNNYIKGGLTMKSKIKYLYLGVFVISTILIIYSTHLMFMNGFATEFGEVLSNDRRCFYSLISSFSAIGFFIEIIFEKLYKLNEQNLNKEIK